MKPSRSNYVICSVCDDNFVEFAEIFLRSLDENYPEHPPVIFLETTLSDEAKQRLTVFPRLSFRHVERSMFEGVPILDSIKGSVISYRKIDVALVYSRLLLWRPDFEPAEKILFLDLDMVVLRPLDELFKKDDFVIVQESYSAANHTFRDPNSKGLMNLLERDGLAVQELRPANAGSFLLPARYRSLEQFRELIRIATDYQDHLQWGDQTVLNIWMLKNGIRPLESYRWNYQIQFLLRRLIRGDASFFRAAIVHFNGEGREMRLEEMRMLRLCRKYPAGLLVFVLLDALWRIRKKLLRRFRIIKGSLWLDRVNPDTHH